jgi:hypothetical protein
MNHHELNRVDSLRKSDICRIVESTDSRFFGLDDTEVANRRQYVNRVKREIEV